MKKNLKNTLLIALIATHLALPTSIRAISYPHLIAGTAFTGLGLTSAFAIKKAHDLLTYVQSDSFDKECEEALRKQEQEIKVLQEKGIKVHRLTDRGIEKAQPLTEEEFVSVKSFIKNKAHIKADFMAQQTTLLA